MRKFSPSIVILFALLIGTGCGEEKGISSDEERMLPVEPDVSDYPENKNNSSSDAQEDSESERLQRQLSNIQSDVQSRIEKINQEIDKHLSPLKVKLVISKESFELVDPVFRH